MSYSCRILADSANGRGDRLVTFEIVFPRPVLAEYNTHCMLARNSASSRAIPIVKMIRSLLEDTFVPAQFGRNQPGMQSVVFLEGDKDAEARRSWLAARNRAILSALALVLGEHEVQRVLGEFMPAAAVPVLFTLNFDDPKIRARTIEVLTWFEEQLGQINRLRSTDPAMAQRREEAFRARYLNVHKQIGNRVLEPFLWHTVITTATEWSNFFALRNHPDAQPEIRTIAAMMQEQYESHRPVLLEPGAWHMPLLQHDELEAAERDPEYWLQVVAGRCARVSYLTHDNRRDPDKDVALYHQLVSGGHMSPLEHIGRSMTDDEFADVPWSAKFHGFVQLRKTVPNEHDFSLVLAERERT